jgi:polyvinyl alcohol dehydrogenase (cytochrome)
LNYPESTLYCIMQHPLPLIAVLFCLVLLIAGAILTPVRAQQGAEWAMGGQNLFNTRNQTAETTININNVNGLTAKWVFTTGSDLPVTPAVVDGAVYVPDFDGNLYKIDANTGQQIWARKLSEYSGRTGTRSRSYPVVQGNVLYIGAKVGTDDRMDTHPSLIAVNAASGAAIWVTEIDAQPGAVLTQSPIVYNGVVYVGVSSHEENFALSASYPCCIFRGNFVAVDAITGRILWRTYMVPDNQGRPGGYSGASIWGSTPVVDAARRAVYITTGNNYTVSAARTTMQR